MTKNTILLLLILTLSLAAGQGIAIGQTAAFITPPAPVFSESERHTELARRRAAVAAGMLDNSVLILFSGEPKQYAGDVDYVFRQENNLYYLTNLKQKNATLVMRKTGGRVTETVYIPERIPSRETWNGHMYSREEAVALSGVTDIVAEEKLANLLDALRATRDEAKNVYLLLPDGEMDEDGMREYRNEKAFAKELAQGYRIINPAPIFAELRHIKSPYELKLLQHAIDITTEAQMRAWTAAAGARMEYEVQAEVEYVFRLRNADFWGYPSIVGCGPNATTLHYEEAQGPVKPGSLILMDVGAEYDHQTADVTRTFPVNGKFSKEQAEIYQIVYEAQEAAARAAKPGVPLEIVGRAADRVIADGLYKLGLVSDPNSDQFRIWYMHSLGHWLGMNVHDVGDYSKPLAPGMTFTNEPGIYIRADALDNLPNTPANKAFIAKVRPAFEKYKDIGVRIEDDMVVTANGVDWMTSKLPRRMSDIEAYIANSRKTAPALTK
jgi:Xaa-Pro aminopeptidase